MFSCLGHCCLHACVQAHVCMCVLLSCWGCWGPEQVRIAMGLLRGNAGLFCLAHSVPEFQLFCGIKPVPSPLECSLTQSQQLSESQPGVTPLLPI